MTWTNCSTTSLTLSRSPWHQITNWQTELSSTTLGGSYFGGRSNSFTFFRRHGLNENWHITTAFCACIHLTTRPAPRQNLQLSFVINNIRYRPTIPQSHSMRG